jgi:hypothetical protein
LTVGVLNGPEEYQFVDVVSGGRQTDGDLAIVDAAVRAVRMYSSDGKFLRSLGGPGSGPGEFEAPGQLWIWGDSVAVWDQRLLRITWFDSEGELARVQSVDLAAISKAAAPPLYPAFVEPLSDGRLLVRLLEKAGTARAVGETTRPEGGALRVAADLSAIDTLMFFGDVEETTVEAPWGPQQLPAPFGKRTWITHRGHPSTVCVGEQEAPEIVCIRPDGERFWLRWDFPAPPPTSAEMEAWKEEVRRDYSIKVSESDLARMLQNVPMPSVRPAYSRILFDRVGNLWVEIGPARGNVQTGLDYLVFDVDGILLGDVVVPAVRVLEIGDDYLLGVYQDELEVEYVQLFDLEKPPGAGRKGETG